MSPAKAVLQHRNPAHAEYELDDGKAAAALVRLDQVQNLVHPDEFPEQRQDLHGDLRMTRGQLKELANDILVDGLTHTVLMRRLADGLYEVVDGTHRTSAHVEAGFETVPAFFRDDYDDQKAAMRRILANELREDLSPLQQARDWQRAIDTGIDQKTLAAQIGKSTGTVSKRLALLDVPAAIADLHPQYLGVDDVSWWKPLAGHDELAEKIAAKVRKTGNPLRRYGFVDAIVDCLGISDATPATAPLNQTWLGKLVKAPSWDLFGVVKPDHVKQAQKLDHAVFGTKTNPDLILVWDVEAGIQLGHDITEAWRAKKQAQKEAAQKVDPEALQRQQEREATRRRNEAAKARTAARMSEQLLAIKKPSDDHVDEMGRVLLNWLVDMWDELEPAEAEALRQVLGKHADVYEDEAWENGVFPSDDVFLELLGRDRATAMRYMLFFFGREAVGTGLQERRDAAHKVFAGETSKQTAAHAERALRAAEAAA